jgi:hypothetical protein
LTPAVYPWVISGRVKSFKERKYMLRVLGLFSAVLLISCASLNQIPEHVIRGAKVRPPVGFKILQHNSKVLRMGLLTKEEKWAIEAWVVDVPVLPASVEDFKKNVEKNEVTFSDKENYQVLDYEIKKFEGKGDFSVLSKWKAKDKKAAPDASYLSGIEMSCIHPQDKTLGYNVLVSRRSGSNEPDSAFDDLAMEFLDGFRFVEP